MELHHIMCLVIIHQSEYLLIIQSKNIIEEEHQRLWDEFCFYVLIRFCRWFVV